MICKECGKDKKHYGHGLCQKCYRAEYYAEHRDEISQNQKKYKVEHREEILQYNKEYRADHRDEIKQCRKEYCMANRDKINTSVRMYRYAHGAKPASENKQCASFLGVHVAERVLSKVFKDVNAMPPNHHGYDFICNKGKKIDAKSACAQTRDKAGVRWLFRINRNTIADFFLCLTFDNREYLTPLYIWLIPAEAINHQMSASISKSTISKWDEFKLDINKVTACCDSMKETNKRRHAY